MAGIMTKVEGLLGAIKSRVQAEQQAAVTDYESLARALAAGRAVEPDEAQAILRRAARSAEEL